MSKACLGHLTQLLLGLAGGRMLLLTREAAQTEQSSSEDSTPSSSSTNANSEDKGEGESNEKRAAETRSDETEGRDEDSLALELLEACLEVVTGARCRRLQAGPPNKRLVKWLHCHFISIYFFFFCELWCCSTLFKDKAV